MFFLSPTIIRKEFPSGIRESKSMKEKRPFNLQMGERIARARTFRELSRERLAEQAGITDRFLYDIESGRKSCTAEVLFHLCKALDVSADYLLSGEIADEKTDLVELVVLLAQLPEESLPYLLEIVKSFGKFAAKKAQPSEI